jgi:hypothetical protein
VKAVKKNTKTHNAPPKKEKKKEEGSSQQAPLLTAAPIDATQ